MISFASLLRFSEDENPAEVQLKAQHAFPKRVAHSSLSLRKPSSRVPQAGKHVILGIATYSKPELELLDEVEKSLECDQAIRVKVAVFDVANCGEMKDFSRYIPGIDGVYQTPVGAIFSDGKLAGHATGMSDVKDLLRRFSVLVGSCTR